jgi:DNA-directed RNA polymerase subunit H
MAITENTAVLEHVFVPKHRLLSEDEKAKIIEKYGSPDLFPKILKKDPAIRHLGAKAGDIIEIERESLTAGKSLYYRVVVSSAEKS